MQGIEWCTLLRAFPTNQASSMTSLTAFANSSTEFEFEPHHCSPVAKVTNTPPPVEVGRLNHTCFETFAASLQTELDGESDVLDVDATDHKIIPNLPKLGIYFFQKGQPGWGA